MSGSQNLAAIGVAAVALGTCGHALFQIVRAAMATRWPMVEGEIAQTRYVHVCEDVDGPGHYEYVAYRYTVNGQPYRPVPDWSTWLLLILGGIFLYVALKFL